ncbi:MAG: HlyD family efflux transporter periplasmic adaptor subunit, partial [Mesorhizobium sp.]
LALRDAELALQRRSIVAPIAGVVGILPIAAGNYVTSQSAVATLDDRSSILVEFWVPERFAAAVKIGAQLSATPIANPNKA